jgi:hypothetical protein
MEHLDESWRKSSYSGNGGASCVEVGQTPGTVLVRDTKQHGYGQVYRFPATAWREFTAGIKANQ